MGLKLSAITTPILEARYPSRANTNNEVMRDMLEHGGDLNVAHIGHDSFQTR